MAEYRVLITLRAGKKTCSEFETPCAYLDQSTWRAANDMPFFCRLFQQDLPRAATGPALRCLACHEATETPK